MQTSITRTCSTWEGVISLNLCEDLKIMRHSKNLSQLKLADRAGLSRNTISNFENGLRSPRIEDLEKIAHALDCPLYCFVSEKASTDPVIATALFTESVSHLLATVKNIDEASEVAEMVKDLINNGEGNEEPTKRYISALGEAVIKSIRFLRQLNTTPEAVAALMEMEREFHTCH